MLVKFVSNEPILVHGDGVCTTRHYFESKIVSTVLWVKIEISFESILLSGGGGYEEYLQRMMSSQEFDGIPDAILNFLIALLVWCSGAGMLR